MAENQTVKRVLWLGVWWPKMESDIYEYIWQCPHYKIRPPKPHATLYQVLIAPKWSKYIVEYLTQHLLPEKVSKARKKAIELEAHNYEMIAM